MTNGLVNGTPSLEGKFGGYHTFTATRTLTLILTFTASLSLGKAAYVPPHLRQQRAASSPVATTNGSVLRSLTLPSCL